MANIAVLAGSGSYTAHKNSYGRWYFIAVAYHDAGSTSIAQKFRQEYSADFNAHAQKPGGYYGYTLANDHAMVAYDATAVTLQAILNSGKTQPTPQDLARELPKITGANAFQGVSGQIAFGSDGDPINKVLLILFVSKDGHIQLQPL
jgi:ABC-type branched-subunit amino acid transport system substrate-binding protein